MTDFEGNELSVGDDVIVVCKYYRRLYRSIIKKNYTTKNKSM